MTEVERAALRAQVEQLRARIVGWRPDMPPHLWDELDVALRDMLLDAGKAEPEPAAAGGSTELDSPMMRSWTAKEAR